MNLKCEICGERENVTMMALGGAYFISICTQHLRDFEDYFDADRYAQHLRKIILESDYKRLHDTQKEYMDSLERKQVSHKLYKDIIEKWVMKKIGEVV